MPIPLNQVLTIEAIVYGKIDAGGSTTVNTVTVFHYKRNAVVTNPTKLAFDTVFQSDIVEPMAACLNERWNQLFNTIRFIDDATDPPGQFSHAEPGGVAGDGMSSLAAAFTLFRTALRGRNFRGSKHFGPLSEADATAPDSDILNAAALARFATLDAALIAPLTDATPNTWTLQILSRSLSKLTKNPTTVITNQVTAILQNKRIGRMRRREVRSVY